MSFKTEAETMSVFNSATDQMHFDIHTLRKKWHPNERQRSNTLFVLESLSTWSTSSLLTHAWHTKMLPCPNGPTFSSYQTSVLMAPPLSQNQANTTGICLTTRKHQEEKGHMQEWRWMNYILCLFPPALYYNNTGILYKQQQQMVAAISA